MPLLCASVCFVRGAWREHAAPRQQQHSQFSCTDTGAADSPRLPCGGAGPEASLHGQDVAASALRSAPFPKGLRASIPWPVSLPALARQGRLQFKSPVIIFWGVGCWLGVAINQSAACFLGQRLRKMLLLRCHLSWSPGRMQSARL